METKPLVILGSNRKNSLTESITRKALGDADFDLIDLLDHTIVHYNYDGNYPAADEFDNIINSILPYDKIIFATPVYWYSMSGVMKVFFDRLTDLITIKKELGRSLKGKHASMIAVGADPTIPDGFEVPFKHTAAYLGIQYDGCIYYATEPKTV
ncbi:NAD(P)H-dependent oxidoreductase [Mucilaginibacter achroorhodeus]|uniref:NAD(P)H-dependent oxidoreductase n=1 Tax=Mucilaginibacter achroorhodeus TaxID=2599294 RepID=A0A563U6V8_9SPHI|nr:MULTISPECIES: NAD(P)H-dependent oxidoreductase [Mucilaginibacter]QXV64935.1 NAD(P)H-dependent oxidoreductase [Mucilaginibacter sp. 21P]TWR27086.1 NAD(P)H-dependent oxidoreductase [Mucilaginibacter achroorhodeus]